MLFLFGKKNQLINFQYFFNPFKEHALSTGHSSLLHRIIAHTAVGVASIMAN